MGPSRADICEYLRRNWDAVRLATAARYLAELLELDVEEVCERMMEGEEKFGPFKLDEMNCDLEFRQEVKDTPAYHAMHLAQRGLIRVSPARLGVEEEQ